MARSTQGMNLSIFAPCSVSSLLSLKRRTSKENTTANPATQIMDSQPKTCDRISVKELTIDTVLAKPTKHYEPFFHWSLINLGHKQKMA
jgi:hypothetical protein